MHEDPRLDPPVDGVDPGFLAPPLDQLNSGVSVVPDWARNAHPDATAKVIAPPDGDLTNPQIRPAELLVDPSTELGNAFRAYARIDPCPQAPGGMWVELVMFGDHLHPFAVSVVAPDPERTS